MPDAGGRQGHFNWGGEAERSSAAAPTCLDAADPGAWLVAPDWQELVDGFWASKAGQDLAQYLAGRLKASAVIYPPEPLKALALTALADVRVVILGQDPYHGRGQAEGLAFSVAPGTKPPPSLRNIFKELQRDQGLAQPANGSLVHWAEQGVLLINTCLTVEESKPASHAGRGWEVLTDAVIRRCSDHGDPKAFLLWGAHAQKKAALVDAARHCVLTANHPSPLSASRGPAPFLGCGHFSAVNEWFSDARKNEIHWGSSN